MSILALIVGLTTQGYLPERVAFFMLFLFVLFNAVGRAIGGVRKSVYYSFMVPFHLILAGFIILRVGWREILGGQWQEVVAILLRLFLSGFGIIIVNLFKLFGGGYISIQWVIPIVILLIILRYIGLQMGSVLVYYTIFSILSPLFTLAVLLVTLRSGMSGREAFATFVALVALLFMLEGLYSVIYGAASSFAKKE